LIYGGGESFLGDVLCEIEITEESNQRSYDSTPIGVINVLDCDVRVQEHT
jgi:hypothetical protein